MKKVTITLALLIGCLLQTYSQTTAIPDANFEQALVTQGIDSDGVVNGLILTADAAAVTGTLNVNNNAITDLTGIEAFTSIDILEVRDNALADLDLTALTGLLRLEAGGNVLTSINVTGLSSLERLIVPNNSLTSIDLTGISTSLRYLYANGNDFTTIDVSALTGLQRLYVYENPNFSSIDVSTIPTLDRFRCYDTSISSLDLTQNPNLAQFRCYNNSSLTFVNLKSGGNTALTSYDSTNTPNLLCIQVDDVTYSTANWTIVDFATMFSLSCTTSIPDSNFEQALINLTIDSDATVNGTILTSDAVAVTGTLNVNNSAITDLTGIGAFSSIDILEVRDNGLTTIDITSIKGLLRLEAGGNGLASINATGLANLERLIVPDNALTSIDLTGLTNLRYLYAYNNNISSLDLTDTSLIQRLYVQDNTNLGSYNTDNLSILDRLRSWNTGITSLDLSQNTAVEQVRIYDNPNLEAVNIQNGTNTNLGSGDFLATGNTSLTCVQVDDVSYSTTNWTSIDDSSVYSTSSCTMSIDEFNKLGVRVYPNPTSDFIFINTYKELDYNIYSIIGRKIKGGNLKSHESSIDVSNLTNGMYIISIRDVYGNKKSLKFSKK